MKLYKAVYLGDANTPYTEITGTSIQEVKDKASNGQNPTGAKINPSNLYGEGFAHPITNIPEGNEKAVSFLGKAEETSIGTPTSSQPTYESMTKEGNEKGWKWMWFDSAQGKQYYRKEGTKWVKKSSESEAKEAYDSGKYLYQGIQYPNKEEAMKYMKKHSDQRQKIETELGRKVTMDEMKHIWDGGGEDLLAEIKHPTSTRSKELYGDKAELEEEVEIAGDKEPEKFYGWYKTKEGNILSIQGNEDWVKAEIGRQGGTFISGQSGSLPTKPPKEELPPTTNQPSNTPTGTNTLKAYDSQGNVVYVEPGKYYPGISPTPPTTPPTPEESKTEESKTEESKTEGEFEAVTPENQVTPEQIKQLYKQYAGYTDDEIESMGIIEYHTQTHPITYADLLNWAQTAPEVAASLAEHQAVIDEEKERYDEGLAIIMDSSLSDEQKEAWKILYENYDGDTVDPTQILEAFEKARENTIDPYWQGLLDFAETDFQNQLDTLAENREREVTTEESEEERRLKEAQAQMEASGTIFSGKAVETLGRKSAAGTAYGEGGEGLLGEQSNLISTSSAAVYAQNQQNIGMEIEQDLGSGAIGGYTLPGYTPVGNVQGQLPTQQEVAQGDYLNQLISNAYGVSQYDNNQQY